MSIETNPSQVPGQQPKEQLAHTTHITVKEVLGGAALIAVTYGGAQVSAEALHRDITVSDMKEIQVGAGENPTSIVKANTIYDPNEVPTGDIVNYSLDLPQNEEAMSNGRLDQGETFVIPGTVEPKK